MVAIKTIRVRGVPVAIAGDEGDIYFQRLDADVTNELLFSIVATQLPGDAVVLDIGANIGVTCAGIAKLLSEAYICAFEPSPHAWPLLNETLRINGLEDRCQAFQVGLGAQPGHVRFFENTTSTTASHLDPEGDCVIALTTIDLFVADRGLRRLDLIKIDVEGFDIDVIDGAEVTLARFRPMVFLEFNSFALVTFRNLNPRTAIEKLVRTFTNVLRSHQGELVPIRSPGDIVNFLHTNMTAHSCVDDLLCLP